MRGKTRGRDAERGTTVFVIITEGAEGSEKLTALKVPRQYRLVLLVILGWEVKPAAWWEVICWDSAGEGRSEHVG